MCKGGCKGQTTKPSGFKNGSMKKTSSAHVLPKKVVHGKTHHSMTTPQTHAQSGRMMGGHKATMAMPRSPMYSLKRKH